MDEHKKESGLSIIGVVLIISIGMALLFYFLFRNVETGDSTERKIKAEQKRKKLTNRNQDSKPARTMKPASLPSLIDKVKHSVVLIKTFDAVDKALATGTGFAFKERGVIVTNRHVVAGSARIEVKAKGKTIPVYGIAGADAKSDIAILSIVDNKEIGKVLKANPTPPKVGESVFVVGNPLGFESTVSTGVVSAIRTVKPFGKVIQITSPISSGSSGSPVFNMKGEVIGIATFVAIRGQNLNFSIPIMKVNKMSFDRKNTLKSLSEIDIDYFTDLETAQDKGEYLVSSKEYNSALPYLKEALKEDPGNGELQTYLGICYREIGMAQKAIDIFKNTIDQDYDLLQAHFELGITYIRFNMPEKALRSLEYVKQKDPEYEMLNEKMGILFAEMKSYREAAVYLEKATEEDSTAETYFNLGSVYMKLNQIDKATRALRNALSLDQTNIRYIHILGLLYYEAGNHRYSIDTLNKGILLQPGNGDLHFQLGFTYLANKDLENAELEYKILTKLKYKNRHKLKAAINQYQYNKRYN